MSKTKVFAYEVYYYRRYSKTIAVDAVSKEEADFLAEEIYENFDVTDPKNEDFDGGHGGVNFLGVEE